MLDAGSGGGYAGTNWGAMSVIDMWMTLQNQETAPYWDVVDGWRKSFELTSQHLSAMQNYRDNLVAAWPPDKSAASAAYVVQLDNLINNLRGTFDAAVANHDAFSNATTALSAAKRELEPIVNEYLANEGKIADYERELASPPPVGEDGIAPPVQNPVAAGRQAELVARARSIMSGLGSDLTAARIQLRRPEPYKPHNIDEGTERGGAGEFIPPPIPPVTPFHPDGTNTSGAGASGVSAAGSASFGGGPQSSVAASPASHGRPPGLILGGTQPPVVAPPAPSPINPPIGGQTSPPLTSPAAMPSLVTPGSAVPRGVAGLPSPVSGGKAPVTAPRGVPTGGVIGGQPPAVRQTPMGRPGPSVNPVGGVIAPNGPNTQGRGGGSSPARSGVQPMGTMGGRSGDAEDGAEPHSRWDPDNPWATEKGVDPVLRPVDEPKIDPGPAIGLS